MSFVIETVLSPFSPRLIKFLIITGLGSASPFSLKPVPQEFSSPSPLAPPSALS